jgi:hypothetical protein
MCDRVLLNRLADLATCPPGYLLSLSRAMRTLNAILSSGGSPGGLPPTISRGEGACCPLVKRYRQQRAKLEAEHAKLLHRQRAVELQAAASAAAAASEVVKSAVTLKEAIKDARYAPSLFFELPHHSRGDGGTAMASTPVYYAPSALPRRYGEVPSTAQLQPPAVAEPLRSDSLPPLCCFAPTQL